MDPKRVVSFNIVESNDVTFKKGIEWPITWFHSWENWGLET
jgi:hypothetical protein